MNNLKLIYLVSFLEGAALMAAELLSSKLMAPFFGTSLTVWTSIFVCTLTALAIGYYLGAKISLKDNLIQKLIYLILCSAIFFFFMFPISKFIMNLTINLSLIVGSLISLLVFLFPLLIAFGIVSPLIIKILTDSPDQSGKKASLIYTISTIGGILATLFFGLNFIPNLGIKISVIIAACLTVVATIVTFYVLKTSKNDQEKKRASQRN